MKTAKLIRNIGAVVTIWLFCEALPTFGQTNETRFEVVTNMVTADANFRIMNGKLYNRAKSKLWKVLQGECLNVSSNQLTIRTFVMEPIYETVQNEKSRSDRYSSAGLFAGGAGSATREPDFRKVKVGETKVWGNKLILRNYNETIPAVGKTIIVAGMQDGNIETGNETLELWDCGKVNVVAVVTTNVFSLNNVATKVATEKKK